MSLNMDVIAQHLRDAGFSNAYVEMTGGGVATIYAGPTHEEPDWGTRYTLVAGPGTYGNPSIGDASEFSFGLDVEDQEEVEYLSESDNERTAADKMIAFLHRHTTDNVK